MRKLIKVLCIMLFSALIITMTVSCSKGGQSQSAGQWKVSRQNFNPSSFPKAPADYTISILTISHSGGLIASDHPAILELEKVTGYKIKLEYILNANYSESLNTRLASRNLPGLLTITGNSMPVVQAAQWGALWDITDIYDLYPNLARADKNVMSNISIEGRNYGIYRQRDFPRSGMIYREDWLANLGLQAPKTLDDLYNVLYAFTYNDPDRNGRHDTFGMNWTGAYIGPFYNLAVMHGAPNYFGNKDGKLTPWFEYDEFYEAMIYSKRLYDEGLINKDFAATSTADWALAFGRGQAGFHIDVADEANRSAVRLRDNGLMTMNDYNAGRFVGVLGLLSNKKGQTRVYPANDGHQGYVAISTVGAKTLQDLHYHLDFMDKLNSSEGMTLLNTGAKDINWKEDPDNPGYIIAIPAAEIPNGWGNLDGFNQFRMLSDIARTATPNEYQKKHMAVFEEIRPHTIINPVTPIALMSPTWTARSLSLNQIISDAVIQFILGRIDRAGFDKEKARWYSEGGTQALAELQTAYEASQR